jgi:hypothetical protein
MSTFQHIPLYHGHIFVANGIGYYFQVGGTTRGCTPRDKMPTLPFPIEKVVVKVRRRSVALNQQVNMTHAQKLARRAIKKAQRKMKPVLPLPRPTGRAPRDTKREVLLTPLVESALISAPTGGYMHIVISRAIIDADLTHPLDTRVFARLLRARLVDRGFVAAV